MRATDLLARQYASVNQIFHDVADDLTPDELTTRVLPHTNLLAFDLWHVARAQDWALQTLVRGVPEVIDDPRWQGRGRMVTHGIGVGLSETQADELARSLALADIVAYADTVHQALLAWLGAIPDDELTREPDVPAQLQRGPRRVASGTMARKSTAKASTKSLAALNRLIMAAPPMVKGGTRAVLGEGPLNADIAFVGEQPGDQEDLAGKPFVGPAGRIQDKADAYKAFVADMKRIRRLINDQKTAA